MGRAECFTGVHKMRTRNPVCGGRTLGTWTSLEFSAKWRGGAGDGMQVWGPCVSSRGSWLHEVIL